MLGERGHDRCQICDHPAPLQELYVVLWQGRGREPAARTLGFNWKFCSDEHVLQALTKELVSTIVLKIVNTPDIWKPVSTIGPPLGYCASCKPAVRDKADFCFVDIGHWQMRPDGSTRDYRCFLFCDLDCFAKFDWERFVYEKDAKAASSS